MARLPRFVLPGYPQHVIQRGNNRQQILFEEQDYWFLWEKIGAAADKFQCQVHAYVLMPNHFHLLLTPLSEDGIGKLMQYVGRYYVQFFNGRYDRTGTLWEGRYRGTLVDPAHFLLPVSRYVESNPVRHGLVKEPGDYAWSSYGANALGNDDPLVKPHPAYEKLGRSHKARQTAYAKGLRDPARRGPIDPHPRGHQQGLGARRFRLLPGGGAAAQSPHLPTTARGRSPLGGLSPGHGSPLSPSGQAAARASPSRPGRGDTHR